MIVLVTGASGYFGSNMIRYLLEKGDEVYGISRNDKLISSNLMYHQIKGDLSEWNFDTDLPPKLDAIIHLAQSMEYRKFPDGIDDMIAVNILSSIKLADYGRKVGVKVFFFSSTGNVYQHSSLPLHEESTLDSSSFYAANKISVELLLKPFSVYFNVIIGRIFGIYGAGQKDKLIPNIIGKIKNSETIQLAGDIGPMINFIHIKDLVEIVYIIINKGRSGYEIFNLGGEYGITLKSIVYKIYEYLNVVPNVERTNQVAPKMIGDISKLKKVLGAFQFRIIDSELPGIIDKTK